jgi:hypothetical protein
MAVVSQSFAPPSRAGWLAGRTRPQALLAFACVMTMVAPLPFGSSFLSWRSLVCVAVFVFVVWLHHGRSLLGLLALSLGFALRRATGMTRWSVSPFSVGRTVGLIDLPGGVGRRMRTLDVVNTRFSGASFLWDVTNGEAVAVLRLHAQGWLFQSDDVKNARVDGWARALQECAGLRDVSRIVTQARALPHLNARSQDSGVEFVDEDVRAVEDGPLSASMGHDMLLAIVVDTSRTRGRDGRRAHTAEGVSEILSARVESVTDLLVGAGADTDDVWWLDAGQLRAQMKCLFNPDAGWMLDAAGRLSDEVPVSTHFDEFTRHVNVDGMLCSTFWVDRWPNEPVQAGWLAAVVGNGRHPLVFTQVWRPADTDRAEHRLDNRLQQLETIDLLNKKVGRPTSQRNANEVREIVLRKQEIADGFGNVDFQGFVTVLASDRARLREGEVFVQHQFRNAHAHLDSMFRQQWAGLVAALPLGQAGR